MAAAFKVTKSDIKAEISSNKSLRASTQILDLELTSLEDLRITASMARKLWKADVRYVSDCFANFKRYNRRSLHFLGIEASVSADTKSLLLKPSLQIGCAPLISPVTGKPAGNIVVKSRFDDDISGVMSLIESSVIISYSPDLKLNSSPMAKPPMYLECLRYVDQYIEVQKRHWQKFSNFSKIESRPSSSTNWSRYATAGYDPANTFKYPNRVNRLVTDHPEQSQALYVLSLAIKEIEKPSTPLTARKENQLKVSRLKQSLQGAKLLAVDEMHIHAADSAAVKELKRIANLILDGQTTQSCAWTLDISKFYERYVQYVFGQYARRSGGHVYSNQKFGISGNKPEWALEYIEPDVILAYPNVAFIVDAKYKRHMSSPYDKSQKLKDDFRHDLHQVLAYSTFLPQQVKSVMLCYPSYNGITTRQMYVHNPITGLRTVVTLIGAPMRKETVADYITLLKKIVGK